MLLIFIWIIFVSFLNDIFQAKFLQKATSDLIFFLNDFVLQVEFLHVVLDKVLLVHLLVFLVFDSPLTFRKASLFTLLVGWYFFLMLGLNENIVFPFSLDQGDVVGLALANFLHSFSILFTFRPMAFVFKALQTVVRSVFLSKAIP